MRWRFGRTGWVVAATATGALVANASAGETTEADGLRWTPHRAAVVPGDRPNDATPATAAVAPTTNSAQSFPAPAPAWAQPEAAGPFATPMPGGPPASVGLPSGVPSLPRRDTYAPLRRNPLPPVGDQLGDLFKLPSWGSMSAALGQPLNRSVPGQPTRPPARGPAIAGPAGRPERLAMNADGVPSVMTSPRLRTVADALPSPGGGPAAPPPADQPSPARSGEILSMPGVPGAMPGVPGGIVDGGIFDPAAVSEPGDVFATEPLTGGFPAYYHVESFYDDPYACEEDECRLPVWEQHGQVCDWLRQFGKPYYGWKWYRDFTVSAGVMSFTNPTDLGINGNYGTNEYINWSMPFWNALGVGWQVGARGTQANFYPTVLTTPSGSLQTNARNQTFVTTGFFTRAFEGRGLQGGAVYDYLHDSWFDNVDIAQVRGEVSYVWGYHELGFWGAFNVGEEQGLFGPVTKSSAETTTIDQYTGFYRLQFGDANEWKFYGGGTGEGDGIVGSVLRAPMASFWALEGTFTYIIPGRNRVIDVDGAGTTLRVAPDAWNVGVNVVFYPAGRSRRSLSSPYRPLFDVADNGTMIRTINQ